MKRFVVGTNRTSDVQDKVFLTLIRARFPRLGWWHQLSEIWLFVDPSDSVSCIDLRDVATKAFPDIKLIVLEATGFPNLWAGFGQQEEYDWMASNWDANE